jgi:hypothetical protein
LPNASRCHQLPLATRAAPVLRCSTRAVWRHCVRNGPKKAKSSLMSLMNQNQMLWSMHFRGAPFPWTCCVVVARLTAVLIDVSRSWISVQVLGCISYLISLCVSSFSLPPRSLVRHFRGCRNKRDLTETNRHPLFLSTLFSSDTTASLLYTCWWGHGPCGSVSSPARCYGLVSSL